MKNILLMLILASSIHIGFSQEKFEKEDRIQAAKAPLRAVEFMDGAFVNANRIKWYAEENLKGKAIEAKVKKDGKLHSVKFDTLGNLKDVEVTVNFKTIPERTQAVIQSKLEALFSSFKIQKTQIQYLGGESVLGELIVSGSPDSRYTTNYELVIRGKKNRKVEYYEIVFDELGAMIRNDRIIQKNTHHLIY